jgi:hypothetical protein
MDVFSLFFCLVSFFTDFIDFKKPVRGNGGNGKSPTSPTSPTAMIMETKMYDNEFYIKEQVRQRKRSLWLQGHPIQARQLETGAQRRARAEQTARAVRSRPLLTPLSQRLALMKAGKVHLTTLDRMLEDGEVCALDKWTQCEEVLQGQAKAACLDGKGGAMFIRSPIPDDWLRVIRQHVTMQRCLPARSLRLLAAFTAIQNGLEGALSPAQYGLRFYPHAKNKRMAFLDGIAETACGLTAEGYGLTKNPLDR